jgi:hypothetical protein
LLVAGEAVGGGPVDFLSHCASNGGCGGKGISGKVEAGWLMRLMKLVRLVNWWDREPAMYVDICERR